MSARAAAPLGLSPARRKQADLLWCPARGVVSPPKATGDGAVERLKRPERHCPARVSAFPRLRAVRGTVGRSAPPGASYKSHLGQFDGLVPLRRCQGEETVRSVLLPV